MNFDDCWTFVCENYEKVDTFFRTADDVVLTVYGLLFLLFLAWWSTVLWRNRYVKLAREISDFKEQLTLKSIGDMVKESTAVSSTQTAGTNTEALLEILRIVLRDKASDTAIMKDLCTETIEKISNEFDRMSTKQQDMVSKLITSVKEECTAVLTTAHNMTVSTLASNKNVVDQCCMVLSNTFCNDGDVTYSNKLASN